MNRVSLEGIVIRALRDDSRVSIVKVREVSITKGHPPRCKKRVAIATALSYDEPKTIERCEEILNSFLVPAIAGFTQVAVNFRPFVFDGEDIRIGSLSVSEETTTGLVIVRIYPAYTMAEKMPASVWWEAWERYMEIDEAGYRFDRHYH